MKKVAILTLNGYFNYGNRLQNYALQEVIKDMGFEVETVVNNTNLRNQGKSKIEGRDIIKKLREKSLIDLSRGLYIKFENYLYKDKVNQQRTRIFKDFSLSYIAETDYSISIDNIPSDLSDRYDIFVTGSDQVWNPNFRKGSSIDFLTFASPEKRISYAASFGISTIPQEYVEDYRLWLSEIAHLSVREDAGAKIIKGLTGRKAEVVLDPTMMLTKEQWLAISRVPSNKPIKRYLLTYFLGGIPKERVNLMKSIAKKNDLEIINLAQVEDRIPYLSGPSEFIDYIYSASVFCTDSFHGAVFSILLDTPFIVFNREGQSSSMNSRIDTLLKTFKLESRLADNIKDNNQIFNIDYSHTIPILESERKKSFNYLEKALT
ncbi:polysaccharide pyruvyl transferase family protein [Oceanobacillus iheyensis]|uniref:polysaccharide pyruvyl transferase family protein n=1 Tax=Oceanobacillus iheyensis TaxID=182710 RepID=UPI00362B9D2A